MALLPSPVVASSSGSEMPSYPYISTTSSAALPTDCISLLGSGSTAYSGGISIMPTSSFCPIGHLRNLRRRLDTQSSLRMKPVNDQLQQQEKKLYSQQQHFGETNRMSGAGQSQNILKEDNNQSARLQLQRQEQNNPSVERSRTYPGFNFVCSASADGVEKLRELLRTYHHAQSCEDNGKKCEYRNCKHMKFHLFCISRCRAGPSCHEKYCSLFRKFFSRHQNCREGTCNLCFPGKATLRNNFQETIDSNAIEPISSTHTTIGTMEQKRPPSKRTKSSHNESSRVSIPAEDPVPSFPEENIVECKKLSTPVDVTSEIIKQDPVLSPIPSKDNITEPCMVNTGEPVMDIEMNPCLESPTNVELSDAQADNEKVQISVEADDVKLKGDCMSSAETGVRATKTKPGKLKNGISLIESLPPEIIREHLNSLKQPAVQSGHETDTDTCSLCRMNDLRYDPPPRYCVLCANKINLDGACYSVKTNLEKLICPACFTRRGKDAVDGKSISKSELVKIDDYASTLPLSEPLAQCQKCGARQHQTYDLVNPKRLEAMKGNYMCPNCILQEIKTGEHLRSTMLGAKDLPTTILSDHLERWVLRRLNEERRQRVTSL